MKSLSQSDYGLIRSLYQDVYAPDIAESILDEFTDEDLDDLTDEYIEEQVIEFFEECLEEGLDIDIVEQTICESVDTELEILTEVTNPAQVAAMRMRDKTSASSGEGQKSGRDAGSMARAKLKVSKQKVGSASPEKKASKLSQIKGAVKKVGQAAKGGVGLATRAVGTAVRAGSAVKSAAKKGYERGRQGSGGGSSSSSSSDSGSDSGSSSSSDSGSSSSSSSSGTGPSSSSSSTGGGSSAAPRKRKDGLLKRGLKKVVRGITKGVSAAAGAVKAGADSLTDRARKEDMNYNKELATIKELYSQVCNHQSEEVEEYIDFLITEGYDCSDLTWNDMYEEYESLDEGLRSAVKRLLGKKKEEPAKPMSRGDELRKKYNVGPEKSDTSAKAQILKKTRAKAESDQKEFGGSRYSKGVADRSKAAHERQLKGGYSKYGADDARGSGNKARKRAAALTKEELEATGLFTVKEIEAIVESENVDEAMSSYDRNRKRAAQRAADRNAARAAGKTGVVPGVGYVTPRREKETYTDEKGTVRHKSGAKNEEFEQLDEISKKLARSYLNKNIEDQDKTDKYVYTKGRKHDDAMKGMDRLEKREKGGARAQGKLYKGTPNEGPEDKNTKVPATGKDPNYNPLLHYPQDKKEKSKGLKGLVKRLTRKEELESLHQAYLSMTNEGEQLDEISKKLARSYVEKGIDDQRSLDKKAYAKGTSEKDGIRALEKIDKRDKGIGMAHDKLYKGTPNEIERNKKIKVPATGKDPAHNYPQDKPKGLKGFVKRLTRKEELESLHQAYLSMTNEGEQLDEISKKLARSYVDKATDDRDKNAKDWKSTSSGEAFNKAERREKNIQRATSKLYKGTPAGEIMGTGNPAKVSATGEDPAEPKEKSKGLKGLVKRITRKEELELDENRRAARAAGGYKDDSKKQTDPSKAGFTGISNSIADIMKQNKEIEARKKK